MKGSHIGRLTVAMVMLGALILSACGSTAAPTTAPTQPAAQPTTAPTTDTGTTDTGTTDPTAAPAEATTAPTTAPETTDPTAAPAGALPAIIEMPAQIAGGRPVEITVIGKPAESQPEALAAWQAQADRFMAKYPNVKVVGSDYTYAPDTFASLVAGKQVPTLFEVYLTDPSKIIGQGVAADLTPYFEKHNLKSVFNSKILDITSQDGKIWGVPRFAYAMGLAYNMDMLKAAGFNNPPATWQELASMSQALTKRDEGVAGFSFITDGSGATGWQMTTIAYTFGARQASIVAPKDGGGYEAAFAKGAPVDALNYVKELRWKYDVLPRENLDWGKNGEVLATGRAAMVVMAGDQFNWIKSTFSDVDMKQFGFAPLPAGPNGKSVSLVGGNIAMISSAATPDQQEAAVYFRLWTQFDPTEIQSGLDAAAADPTVVIGAPVLPLYVGDYQTALHALQQKYANLPIENYTLFVDAVTGGKVELEPEPLTAGQEYYTAMGSVVSSILTDQAADPASSVDEAAKTFQTNVLNNLK